MIEWNNAEKSLYPNPNLNPNSKAKPGGGANGNMQREVVVVKLSSIGVFVSLCIYAVYSTIAATKASITSTTPWPDARRFGPVLPSPTLVTRSKNNKNNNDNNNNNNIISVQPEEQTAPLPTTTKPINNNCSLPGEELVFYTIVRGLFDENVIPSGDILDIGANKGDWSCAFACLYANRVVHAADPNPLLKTNIPCLERGYSNLRVHTLAMSDSEGKISFDPERNGDFVGNLEARQQHAAVSDDKGGNVEVTTLDAFFRRQNSRPGFMHLDVEGYERKLMLGGQETISKHRPVFSYEVHVNTTASRDTIAQVERIGYVSLMINEICGFWQNCRNILALPKNSSMSLLKSPTLALGLRTGTLLPVTSATCDEVYAAHSHAAKPVHRSEEEAQQLSMLERELLLGGI